VLGIADMAKYDAEWYKKLAEGKKDYPLPLYAPWTSVYEGKKKYINQEINRS
jgi:hypothetical protein